MARALITLGLADAPRLVFDHSDMFACVECGDVSIVVQVDRDGAAVADRMACAFTDAAESIRREVARKAGEQ